MDKILTHRQNYLQKIGRVWKNKTGSAMKRPTPLELHGWMWTVGVEDRNGQLCDNPEKLPKL